MGREEATLRAIIIKLATMVPMVTRKLTVKKVNKKSTRRLNFAVSISPIPRKGQGLTYR